VKVLVDRFYDLMELEPRYAALRAVHGDDLSRAREHLFWFLCGWLGGPLHRSLRASAAAAASPAVSNRAARA
jgi:hemoglobin